MKLSPALRSFVDLPPEARADVLADLTSREAEALLYSWDLWARPEQIWRPSDKRHTIYLAGRGAGKTRTGCEATRWIGAHPELCDGHSGYSGRTAHDTNTTMTLFGILECCTEAEKPKWYRNDRLLAWPSGCVTQLFSGDTPDGFRGPNLGYFWDDEQPHWRKAEESWRNADMMLRAGPFPCSLSTSTPVGSRQLVERCYVVGDDGMPLLDDAGVWRVRDDVRLIRGSSFDNAANLPPSFIPTLERMARTRIGQQEVGGHILLGTPGAPVKIEWIQTIELDELPALSAIAVGVDPSGGRNEIGIVVVGRAGRYYYVLEDASGEYSPEGWATATLEAWQRWHDHPAAASASSVIAVEDNYGGDMVESTLRLVRAQGLATQRRWAGARVQRVRATKDAFRRASLISPLYELGQVHRVGSPRNFSALEFQITTADPTKPKAEQALDRMDALVWALLDLAGDGTDRVAPLAVINDLGAELRRRGMIR